MTDRWRVLSSRTVIDRPWLRLREEHVRLPNGAEIECFHVLDVHDWAAALAITDDRRIVLVEQYRHGIARRGLELPAGVLDDGETPLEAARRELLEETGYAADDCQPLLSVAPEPNRSTQFAHFFLFHGARQVAEACPEVMEEIDVRLVHARDLLQAVDSGAVHHAVHVAAILFAARCGLLD
jgi:8-oxo-dGTP pyrophosphatase MutT (NUDIX family)